MPEVLNEPSFLAVAERVISFVPQSSIFGAILEHGPVCRIVKSRENAIMQHNPLSWEVLGPRFVYLNEKSKFGKYVEEAVNYWLYSMSEEDKARFAGALFSVIDSTGAKTLTDLSHAKIKNFNQIMKALRGMDKVSPGMMPGHTAAARRGQWERHNTKTRLWVWQKSPANITKCLKES